MQNCDRPKDSALHKKTKTETQFKREFLKSEDVPGQKDNLDRVCPGPAFVFAIVNFYFAHFYELFSVVFITGKFKWKLRASSFAALFKMLFKYPFAEWHWGTFHPRLEYLCVTYLNNFDRAYILGWKISSYLSCIARERIRGVWKWIMFGISVSLVTIRISMLFVAQSWLVRSPCHVNTGLWARDLNGRTQGLLVSSGALTPVIGTWIRT